jgi:hypothetical protein
MEPSTEENKVETTTPEAPIETPAVVVTPAGEAAAV